MRNLCFKITFKSGLSGSMSVNLWRISLSLSRSLPGASFFSFSMSANLAQFKVLAWVHLSPSRIYPAECLCYGNCLASGSEVGYSMFPPSPCLISRPFISKSSNFPQNLSFFESEVSFCPKIYITCLQVRLSFGDKTYPSFSKYILKGQFWNCQLLSVRKQKAASTAVAFFYQSRPSI